MKNLCWFLLGVGVGAGGTFLYLHKYIQDTLKKRENEEDLPFTAGTEDNGAGKDTEKDKKEETDEEQEVKAQNADNFVKTAYNKVVQSNYLDTNNPQEQNWTSAPVPVMPREGEDAQMQEETPEVKGIYEIDDQEYLADTGDEKEYLVWFRGDHVLCEENGQIIQNSAMLIGHDWFDWVGHYAVDTAFVKNSRLCTKYEVKCEEGLYTDEYGPYETDA